METLYYIKNEKTNKNYDVIFNHFYNESFEIDVEKDKVVLELIIKTNPEKFKNCIIKKIIMEAKEKAKELIEKSTSLGNSYCAKRHCLWLCDEIIKATISLYIIHYWQEVKQELEKL